MQRPPFRLLATALWTCFSIAQAATLSNNLPNSVSGTEEVANTSYLAASFGTDAFQYSLSSATLLMSSAAAGSARLDLYASSSLRQPSAFLTTLSSPAGLGSGLSPVVFSGSGFVLRANTTYWLVLKAPSSTLEWAYTNDNSGSGVGFQHTWGASDDAGASWFTATTAPMMMRVDAAPLAAVPEPSSLLLLVIGVTASVMVKRKWSQGGI